MSRGTMVSAIPSSTFDDDVCRVTLCAVREAAPCRDAGSYVHCDHALTLIRVAVEDGQLALRDASLPQPPNRFRLYHASAYGLYVGNGAVSVLVDILERIISRPPHRSALAFAQ